MLKLSTSKCGHPKEYTESRTWIWFIWYGGCPVRRLFQANSSQTNSMTWKWNQFLCKFAQNNVTCVYCQMVFSACELPFRFVWKQASPTFGQSQVVDVPICPWNMFVNLEISIIFFKKTITISHYQLFAPFITIFYIWYWNPPLCWTQPQQNSSWSERSMLRRLRTFAGFNSSYRGQVLSNPPVILPGCQGDDSWTGWIPWILHLDRWNHHITGGPTLESWISYTKSSFILVKLQKMIVLLKINYSYHTNVRLSNLLQQKKTTYSKFWIPCTFLAG